MFMLSKPRKVQKDAGTHKPIFYCGVTGDGIGLVLITLAASVEMFQVRDCLENILHNRGNFMRLFAHRSSWEPCCSSRSR
jgi:hypothetical protein